MPFQSARNGLYHKTRHLWTVNYNYINQISGTSDRMLRCTNFGVSKLNVLLSGAYIYNNFSKRASGYTIVDKLFFFKISRDKLNGILLTHWRVKVKQIFIKATFY